MASVEARRKVRRFARQGSRASFAAQTGGAGRSVVNGTGNNERADGHLSLFRRCAGARIFPAPVLGRAQRLRTRSSGEFFVRSGELTADATRASWRGRVHRRFSGVMGSMDWRCRIFEYGDAAAHRKGLASTAGSLCESDRAVRAPPLRLFQAFRLSVGACAVEQAPSLKSRMKYRAEATSVEGFVQQIACCFLRHGYVFYVTGVIPPHKDSVAVDEKIITKYKIDVSEATRSRRKKLGYANLQYLRHERFFAIFATPGEHRFFHEERDGIRDIRTIPLKFSGYSISYRRGGRTRKGEVDHRWHAHVQIERRRYLDLKEHFIRLAQRRSPEHAALAFYYLPIEPYAPVRRQLLKILKAANQARKAAGWGKIPTEVLALRRRVVRPFASEDWEKKAFGQHGVEKTSQLLGK